MYAFKQTGKTKFENGLPIGNAVIVIPCKKAVFGIFKIRPHLFGVFAVFLPNMPNTVPTQYIPYGFPVPESGRNKQIFRRNSDTAVFQQPMKSGGVFLQCGTEMFSGEKMPQILCQFISGDTAFRNTRIFMILIEIISVQIQIQHNAPPCL